MTSGTQSHITQPSASGTRSARCPIAKPGSTADAGNAEIVAPDELVIFRQFLTREPRLALPVHKLPLVLADQAGLRRLSAFGKLGPTLFARP